MIPIDFEKNSDLIFLGKDFKDIEKALKLSERTVLKLNNPHLSEATLEATASEAQQFEVVK